MDGCCELSTRPLQKERDLEDPYLGSQGWKMPFCCCGPSASNGVAVLGWPFWKMYFKLSFFKMTSR